ncbi:MAG: ribose 5-phosphate isomerase B [Sandaracinaceae bacterium]|nr:ribose 5-phosphate isomerase B [Sandaracinaceae bacterium]
MASRIIVGADHAGLPLKGPLVAHLKERGFEVEDVGTHGPESVDYPDFGHRVASAVAAGEHELGLLICGSGVGMSITANKHDGVRAVLCSEPYSAAMARAHNDANVLCLGARVVGPGLAEAILDAFLGGAFEGGRHARRVAKIEPAKPA